MLIGIILCIIFVVLAVLMMMRKLPAFIALPIMAVAIAVLSGMPLMEGDENIFTTVLVNGSSKMASNIIILIFAGWLTGIMGKTGVASTIIKKAAELGGDRPAVVAALLCGVSFIMFSGLSGVGGVAMVGSIVLPMLMALGFSPMASAHMFLGALSAGFAIRPSNIQVFINIFGGSIQDVMPAAWVVAAFEIVFVAVYLTVYMKRGRKFAFAAPASDEKDEDLAAISNEKQVKGVRGFLACLTPLLPIVLTYFFNVPVVACYIIGIIYLAIMTYKGPWDRYCNMLNQSAFDGIRDTTGAIILFVTLGMILNTVAATTVQNAIMPFMQAITPSTLIGLVIFCAVLAPLSLYRGPMNIQGLGACLGAIIMAIGHFNPIVLTAVFYCTSRWPTQSCPTATQVVWISNFVGEDPNQVAKKVFIPNWIMTIGTLVVVGLLYRGM